MPSDGYLLWSYSTENVQYYCTAIVTKNVKHRECLCDHPSQRLMIKCLTIIQIELEFGNVGF